MIEFKLIFVFIFHLSAALNLLTQSETINCNGEKRFNSFDKIIYINWPQRELTPTRCSYAVKSPVNTFISAKIYHDLSGNEPSCRNQRILVSRDGNNELKSASKFCGVRKSRPVEINSIANEMTFRIDSKNSTGGVQIVLKIYKINQQNCDCSWNVGRKIVAG